MKLSVRLFDKEERAYLAKVLELAGKRARIPVSSVTAATADVIFLCAEEPGAHALLNASDSQRIIVVYGGDPESHRWTLPRPATSQNLMPLLDSLSKTLSTPSESPLQAGAEDASVLDADNDAGSALLFPSLHGNFLLERLLELNAEQQPWQCTLQSGLSFVVDPVKRRLHADDALLSDYEQLARQATRLSNPVFTRLHEDALPNLCADLESMPLEAFCWQLALKSRPEHPKETPLLDRRFRLKRWPSFSMLPHTPAQLTMTGRLMRQSLSVRELCSDNRATLEEAVQLFNCASACELIELDDLADRPQPQIEAIEPAQAATLPRKKVSGKSRLFNRILRSITGGPQHIRSA